MSYDQREDLHALSYPPGSIIPIRGKGQPDGVYFRDDSIDDPSLTPEQIVRMAIRVASGRGDFSAIASLALSLDQITSKGRA